MSTSATARHRTSRTERLRPVLLGLAALRAALEVAAIPLAPWLYRDHVAVLVLLRPAKEVLLFAGFKVRDGDANAFVLVFATVPLLLLATWVFYGLGRSYRRDLDDADLPGVAGRLLPRRRIRQLAEAITTRGWTLIVVGRLASMPSTLVAAAAGASGLPVRTFLLADAAGYAASVALMLTLGYLLGEAREALGTGVTVVGAIAVLGLLAVLGWRVKRAQR